MPLLLDVPGNPTGRRLLTTNEIQREKPLLLWMNDYSESFNNFPEIELLGNMLSPSYPELWDEHKATVTMGTSKECYRFGDDGTLTLFTAKVKNSKQGDHTRPESGDEYLVCFSNCESEHLLKSVFCAYRFHLHAVMLILQGGPNLHGLAPYRNLPTIIAERSKEIGFVDFWVIDKWGQEKRQPISETLKNYKCIGGKGKWGSGQVRMYRSTNNTPSH
ncbi:MAG: hypothetical protein PHI31_12715 [Desulfuromonadaceae bacterium]|nr:hypothetical protein [Desulfuromonadaceae bacterium]